MRTQFALFGLLGLALSTCSAEPDWKCRVCEDVVQTYHDHYRCAGEFDDWGDPQNPDIPACNFPRFSCEMTTGSLQEKCFAWERALFESDERHSKLWNGLMRTGQVYATCVEIGDCKDLADPDFKQNALHPCHTALKTDECKYKVGCQAAVDTCGVDCYLCNKLLREWPIFQEICKPAGASYPAGAAAGAGLLPPNALIELSSTVVGAGAETPGSTMLTGSTIMETCLDFWREVKVSRKARYFTSWKSHVSVLNNLKDRVSGNMWDANVVCKCLGKCPLEKFENLGLVQTCAYDEQAEQLMQLIDANQANLYK